MDDCEKRIKRLNEHWESELKFDREAFKNRVGADFRIEWEDYQGVGDHTTVEDMKHFVDGIFWKLRKHGFNYKD